MGNKYDGPYTLEKMVADLEQQHRDGDACIWDPLASVAKLRAAEELSRVILNPPFFYEIAREKAQAYQRAGGEG